MSQREARDSAQDQHVGAAAWSWRQQALLCLLGVTLRPGSPAQALASAQSVPGVSEIKCTLFPVKKKLARPCHSQCSAVLPVNAVGGVVPVWCSSFSKFLH